MADISKINGVPIANIEKLDAVLAANIAKVNGLVFSIAPAFTGLLDTYTGAAAGYSTRRLASSATVLMRVRRETAGGTGDDDEADVAYDSNNELSLDSAISNASAGVTATTLGQFLNVGTVNGTTYTNPDSLTVTASCFVDEWKDQSGNANHAEQATHGSQPQIHSGTVNTDLITENGKPAIYFPGSGTTGQGLDAAGFGTGATRYFSYVTRITQDVATTSYHNVLMFMETAPSSSGNFLQVYSTNASNNIRLNFPTNALDITSTTAVNVQHLLSVQKTSTDDEFWIDGTSQGTATGTQSLEDELSIGRFSFGPPGAGAIMRFQELIVWNTDQDGSGNIAGIETNINSEYLIYQPTDAPTSGLLATYTGAAAAYSVRQLSDKAVIALRIRRDSDDEEINIGWDANGDLDTTAISDFCSTANGYVTRWWDQSTNGNHADQATDSNQPQIYNGTAVITATNNIASLKGIFANNTILLTSALGVDFSGGYTWYNVFEDVGYNKHTFHFKYYNAQGSYGLRSIGVGTNAEHEGSNLVVSPGTNTLSGAYIQSVFYDGSTSADLYLNSSSYQRSGTNTVTTLDADTSAPLGVMGAMTNATTIRAASMDGYMQELIIWDNDESSNRTGIESDINTYFDIY